MVHPSKLTQKALARQLGVSVATISRVLNDRPGVSEEIRAQVLDLLAQSGYTPNGTARSLVTSRTQMVAFVVHEASHASHDDPFYPFIVAGTEAHLSTRQYHMLLTSVDQHTMEQPQGLAVISERRVDGLILAGPDIAPSFIIQLHALGLPLVLVDNCLQNQELNCVLNDDFGGEYAATRHLIEKGRRRIIFLAGPEAWPSSRERGRGYAQAMTEAGLTPHILSSSSTTIQSGEQLMQQALERWSELDAVCAANDAMAIGALRVLAQQGRKVPETVAVMGFDDIAWAAMTEPPLSTVQVHKRRLGMLAAQRLLDVIEDPESPPVKTLVSTQLVLRRSSGD